MVTGDRSIGGNAAFLSSNGRAPNGESLAHAAPLEGSARAADCINATGMAAAATSLGWADRSAFPGKPCGMARLSSTGGCQFSSSFPRGRACQSAGVTTGIGCACYRIGLPAIRRLDSAARLAGWQCLWPGSGVAGDNSNRGGGSPGELAHPCRSSQLVGGWVVFGAGWVVAQLVRGP